MQVLRVLELGAAVAGAVEDFEFDAGAGGFEGCDEDFALFHGDERVGVAVLDEEGGIVFGGVTGGVGVVGEFQILLDEGADQLVFGGLGGVVIHGGGVVRHAGDAGGAIPIDDGLDAGGGVVTGGTEIGHEMAAGGGAPEGDAGGVDIVFFGVGAEPAEGGFAVVDVGGEGGFLGVPVADAGAGVALLDEGEDWRLFLGAGAPGAAVDPDD